MAATDFLVLSSPLPSQQLGQLIEEPFSPSSSSYVAPLAKFGASKSNKSHLTNDWKAFDSVCRDPQAQQWMFQMAKAGKSFSFITSIQELNNNKTRNAASPGLSRKDSASEIADRKMYGVEARKVKCKFGRSDEPHTLDDIDYEWNYFDLNEEMQFAVGLGGFKPRHG